MPVPLEVFCCYAREDQEMLEHLKKHLMPFQRSEQITIWSDVNLNAGVEWEKELHLHLESADLILLLISPDFMASDYCYCTEMKRAIERHDQGKAHVIPILLRPVHWATTPFAKLQIIPTNATPVTIWSNRDEAFHDVTEHISQILSERQKQKHVSSKRPQKTPSPPPSAQASYSPVPPSLSQNRSFINVENQQMISLPSLPLVNRPKAIGVLRTLIGHTKDIPDISLSADGSLLASSGLDRTVKLWNVQTGQRLLLPPGAEKIEKGAGKIALSADGSILVYAGFQDSDDRSYAPNYSAGFDYPFCVWNIQSAQLIQEGFVEGEISHILLSADGLTMVCGYTRHHESFGIPESTSSHINIYNPHREESRHEMEFESFTRLALSANGLMLAAIYKQEKTITIWNTQTGQTSYYFRDESSRNTASLAFNGNGSMLADGSTDGSIMLWSMPDLQKNRRKPLRTFSCATKSIALSQDGLILAGASYGEKKILLWNTKSGKLLCTLQSPTGAVSSIALSTDGRVLASGCSDGTIHIWGVK